MGAVLVANLTRPVLHGVSILLIGNWLGLEFSKLDDKQVNANGRFLAQTKFRQSDLPSRQVLFCLFLLFCILCILAKS